MGRLNGLWMRNSLLVCFLAIVIAPHGALTLVVPKVFDIGVP
jgi:hypothetical protein